MDLLLSSLFGVVRYACPYVCGESEQLALADGDWSLQRALVYFF
jgi:hypothetical protein